MAWDKDRPYAPFILENNHWNGGVTPTAGSMDSWTLNVPSKHDIDRIWAGETVDGNKGSGHSRTVFRPFKDVELTLTYAGFSKGRSAVIFWWTDEDGRYYPMFCAELDRLMKDGIVSKVMSGVWSAEKRSANYGIRLEKLNWREATDGKS